MEEHVVEQQDLFPWTARPCLVVGVRAYEPYEGTPELFSCPVGNASALAHGPREVGRHGHGGGAEGVERDGIAVDGGDQREL